MMTGNYLIVDKKILPEYFDKVIEARAMLSDGRAGDVSEAVKAVGISRSTYYKYKDYIFAPNADTLCRKAIISFSLRHESGLLSKALDMISSVGLNILTISQNLPINGSAHIVFSADISALKIKTDEVLYRLSSIPGASNVRLIAIE